jgi:hypothetical protein
MATSRQGRLAVGLVFVEEVPGAGGTDQTTQVDDAVTDELVDGFEQIAGDRPDPDTSEGVVELLTVAVASAGLE